MKRTWLVAAAVLNIAFATQAQEPTVTPAMLTATLERAVTEGTPGVSAAIATRRGVIWTGVAGAADMKAGTPIDEANLFGIGSITKVFVAVTVLQLVEAHRLSLDATPEAILGASVTRDIANAGTATVAQLLAHTAGVPSWEDDPAWIRKGRGSGYDPSHRWGKTEALDYIRGKPAEGKPGETFAYSNSGYTLLGLIVEKVTGQPVEAEIRRRILTPLALHDTYLEGFETGQPGRVPHRYHYATPAFQAAAGLSPQFVAVREGLVYTGRGDLSVEWAAGGMISSPRDLVTFATALRDGKLLQPASLAFMQQWTPAVPGLRVGHGLFEATTKAGPVLGHTGGVLGFSASLWWLPGSDTVVAILSNGGSMHAGKTPPTAADIALRSDFTALAVRFAAQQTSLER